MTFKPHLHWSFNDEHVLLPNLVLSSLGNFVVAVILVLGICLLERLLTFMLDKQWVPRMFNLSRTSIVLWRTGLYSAATFLRLCYMLVAMTFNAGLIVTIILALSSAQLAIELYNLPRTRDSFPRRDHGAISQPLLSDDDEQTYPPTHKSVKTRPRSKSKPDDIFIHPAESNIARADAVALELGLAGDTDRVQANSYTRDEPAWEIGKGRDMAREILLGSQSRQKKPSREQFFINNDSDSDYS